MFVTDGRGGGPQTYTPPKPENPTAAGQPGTASPPANAASPSANATSAPTGGLRNSSLQDGGLVGALGGADTIGITSGPRYPTLDEAARNALSHANPMSRSDNLEFGGLLYKDPSNGRYGGTTPSRGSATGFDPTSVSVPKGSTLAGDYHTHGDYSKKDASGNVVRTSKAEDQYNSDNFSKGPRGDLGGITADAVGRPEYAGYLGTPSGSNLKFDPATSGPGKSGISSLDPGLNAAKGGAFIGAGAGAGVTLFDAARSGHLNADTIEIAAENGAGGAGLGAASSVVQRGATGVIDRVAGQTVERAATSAFGSDAALVARTAASEMGGAGAAGAVVSAGVSVYENWNELTHGNSKAIGNVAGDTVVGAGSALAGATAGAAIGSVVPVAGTIVGAGVGLVAGYAANEIMRAGGVDKLVSHAVSSGVNFLKSLV